MASMVHMVTARGVKLTILAGLLYSLNETVARVMACARIRSSTSKGRRKGHVMPNVR